MWVKTGPSIPTHRKGINTSSNTIWIIKWHLSRASMPTALKTWEWWGRRLSHHCAKCSPWDPGMVSSISQRFHLQTRSDQSVMTLSLATHQGGDIAGYLPGSSSTHFLISAPSWEAREPDTAHLHGCPIIRSLWTCDLDGELSFLTLRGLTTLSCHQALDPSCHSHAY